MQDGCRILGSGKYGKMAKKYQHHKLPSCLGYPKHEGKDEENLTHFFGHYQIHRLIKRDFALLRRDTKNVALIKALFSSQFAYALDLQLRYRSCEQERMR